MNDPTRDNHIPEGPLAEPTPDYRIREIEARLDRRIEALESERNRMRWTVRLAGAGFVLMLLTLAVGWARGEQGAVSARSITAEEVLLRDGDGSTRARLAADADGRVQFSLSDREGRGRIRLTVLADGSPGVSISDADARPRAVLGYLPDGTTNLVFADGQGMSRAVLGVEPDGSTHALFSDRGGQVRTLVGVGADGVPSVSVLDREEQGSPDAQ